jgi:hypothetical protein
MSIITDTVDKSGRYQKNSAKVRVADPKAKDAVKSLYTPTPLEQQARTEFLKDFRNGWQTMHLPRPEFNDLSLYQRHVTDMLAFNTYQENDGQPLLEDRLGGWRSTAMRPIQRNKSVSITAHMTARQLVPKVFAYDEEDESQEDSAKVMGYLVDWAREQANYPFMALYRTITSLYSPISWGYSEYSEVYRNVRDGKDDKGKPTYKLVLDEEKSGFKHTPMATDQVFFADFYTRECQDQDFIILRRIMSYDMAKTKYGHRPNFVYVKPGIQVIMDDANRGYYNVYDPHMRDQDVEELIRWRKSTDSREIMVNGILISEPYEENPRQDHQYPWDCFYYLPINEKCIAGKSLIFALGPESALLNTQYQIINDANYLNLFPPTVTTGSDKVGMDVIVPGLNLAFADKDVKMNTLRMASDSSISTAMSVMQEVEKSLSESSQDPIQQGQQTTGTPSTAYEISRIEQNAATVLGLTMKFMANSHVIPYGKLLLSDILQYMTVADAAKTSGSPGLVYKTFFTKEPGATGKTNKISFDSTMPDTMDEDTKLAMSYELLIKQGGIRSNMMLWKVNPSLFREYKYSFTIDADVLNPRSAELTRAFDLETYDRAINSPVADQEKLFTDLLMSSNPKTSRDPKDYVSKTPPPTATPPVTPGASVPPGQQPNGGSIAKAPPPIFSKSMQTK